MTGGIFAIDIKQLKRIIDVPTDVLDLPEYRPLIFVLLEQICA